MSYVLFLQNLPTSTKSSDAINETVKPPLEEPLYQLPKNEPISPPVQSPAKDTSIFSQVNIDTFKERTFQKSSEVKQKFNKSFGKYVLFFSRTFLKPKNL